ncbi:MAG: FHA domain-containing protein [Planctomycetes bacterium]|nr:FHA domain-containing protein [Planctomycetota bacterium]
MSQATLLVIQGVDQGTRFEIESDEVGLGRGVHNSIRIHDTEVSRAHAKLVHKSGRFQLHDLNSSNGTYVNGSQINTRDLVTGDEIQIGRTVMRFTADLSRNEQVMVADQVALLAEPEPDHTANIVGQASPHDDRTFARLATESGRAQTVANLQVLYRISEEAVRPSNSVEQMLGRILELTIEVTGADRGCILLRDPQTHEVSPQVFRHRAGLRAPDRMGVSRSIVDYVLKSAQGVRTSDARADSRFVPGQSILEGGIREAICAPMQGRYDLQGAIYIDITTSPERILLENSPAGRFNEDLLRLVVAIARQSALAVEDNRYQLALVKAERLAAVGQTIAILSHHIKNILQGVRGGSYLIDLGLKDHNEDLVRKGWSIVEKNQEKIYQLVMDMLTFGKERQPKLSPADLNATVGDICELLMARAAELKVALNFVPGATVPPMCIDAEGIHRAVLNIVGNALDAVEGRDSAEVRVTTGYDPETSLVTVSVADNGPGIAPEHLPQIFNIFESTKGARGTGIGLAVSLKIVREHGGDIHVESTLGAGATFTLEWPLIEEPSGS